MAGDNGCCCKAVEVDSSQSPGFTRFADSVKVFLTGIKTPKG